MTLVSVPAGVAGAFIADALGARSLQVIVSSILVEVGVQMLATATRRLRAERARPMLPAGPEGA
jgi:uncharacterized membrane protein YfcA